MVDGRFPQRYGVSAAGARSGRFLTWRILAVAGLLALAGCEAGNAPPQTPGSFTAHVNGQTGVFVGGFAR